MKKIRVILHYWKNFRCLSLFTDDTLICTHFCKKNIINYIKFTQPIEHYPKHSLQKDEKTESANETQKRLAKKLLSIKDPTDTTKPLISLVIFNLKGCSITTFSTPVSEIIPDIQKALGEEMEIV
jgi:hypothetical protein